MDNSAPVLPLSQAPVRINTKPVMVHTTIVSIKVWVMDTRAWVTGCLVWAAAAAIGALPSPDSLENTPRATPMRMPIITLAPKNPPEAAVGVKACLTTMARAAGMPVILSTRMIKAPPI